MGTAAGGTEVGAGVAGLGSRTEARDFATLNRARCRVRPPNADPVAKRATPPEASASRQLWPMRSSVRGRKKAPSAPAVTSAAPTDGSQSQGRTAAPLRAAATPTAPKPRTATAAGTRRRLARRPIRAPQTAITAIMVRISTSLS
ncbi:MAG TPA: hypothetical protein VHX59_11910 [Mycobacteriales bacterium]|nr:hypothetical protein [Mycobacteriales bacterium]